MDTELILPDLSIDLRDAVGDRLHLSDQFVKDEVSCRSGRRALLTDRLSSRSAKPLPQSEPVDALSTQTKTDVQVEFPNQPFRSRYHRLCKTSNAQSETRSFWDKQVLYKQRETPDQEAARCVSTHVRKSVGRTSLSDLRKRSSEKGHGEPSHHDSRPWLHELRAHQP